MRIYLNLVVIIILLQGCNSGQQDAQLFVEEYITIEIPPGFPEVDFPGDNRLTRARVELGRKLFYDPILSRNKTVSCASCHFPETSFSDTVAVSLGEFGRKGERNAPPLHNVAYLPYLFKDGGIPNLELQIKAPVEDPNEMNFNMHEATLRVAEESAYQTLAMEAYDREVDAFVITRGLAAFMRTFISGNSKYDKYQIGLDTLSSKQMHGMKLFYGDKAKCANCHSGFNFTNNEFQNNGSKEYYADTGRARITLKIGDHGKFRVPSLRNVAVTAPYMHDGSYGSLEEVLNQYQRGGSGHWNQSNIVSEIQLNDDEKEAIIAFLKTLTDTSFLNKNEFKPLN